MRIAARGVKPCNRIEEKYFEWLVGLICDGGYGGRGSWFRLLRLLHETEFAYSNPMDENRAADGCDLRRRFDYEEEMCCFEEFRFMPCTVLEMMVALAVRCEEHIMANPEKGNRTGKWFFDMVYSLGLIEMDDDHFDRFFCQGIVSRFLRHEYARDGHGGLFTLKYRDVDMRQVEIWYQAMWYLNEVIYEEGV